jgi:hypothetical protein
MQTQFTKGTWKQGTNQWGERAVFTEEHAIKHHIATVKATAIQGEMAANAQLITASPILAKAVAFLLKTGFYSSAAGDYAMKALEEAGINPDNIVEEFRKHIEAANQ